MGESGAEEGLVASVGGSGDLLDSALPGRADSVVRRAVSRPDPRRPAISARFSADATATTTTRTSSRLATHPPQPRSLIRIPFGLTSGRMTSGGAGFRPENVCQPSTRAEPATHQGVAATAATHPRGHLSDERPATRRDRHGFPRLARCARDLRRRKPPSGGRPGCPGTGHADFRAAKSGQCVTVTTILPIWALDSIYRWAATISSRSKVRSTTG